MLVVDHDRIVVIDQTIMIIFVILCMVGRDILDSMTVRKNPQNNCVVLYFCDSYYPVLNWT